MKRNRKRNEELTDTLRMMAPGTALHAGMENILRAKTGALIVIGYNEQVARIATGGFSINSEFTANALYELAKMDGAVVLSGDGRKILYANVELSPDLTIPTQETGIRHRTAERAARQTNLSIVSISQRRDVITLFKGAVKYTFQDENKLLAKANQALQTLEKYRRNLDDALRILNTLEMEDRVTLEDVCHTIKLLELVLRVAEEIEQVVVQLGSEGRMVTMQLEELVSNLDQEYRNLLLDYGNRGDESSISQFSEMLERLSHAELLDLTRIARILNYRDEEEILDAPLFPRGYRQLAHIPRLPQSIISNVVDHYSDFQKVLSAESNDLEEVDGVGEVRARMILEGLRRKRDAGRGAAEPAVGNGSM